MELSLKAVFDTNILIDYLNGIWEAAEELKLYKAKHISITTYMEVLVGVEGQEEEKIVRSFLSSFKVHKLSIEIAEQAIFIRRETKVKLPDAVVYATAKEEGCILVTRNTKDFKEGTPDVRVPYKL